MGITQSAVLACFVEHPEKRNVADVAAMIKEASTCKSMAELSCVLEGRFRYENGERVFLETKGLDPPR
jgi:hypothetical protein